MFGSQKQAPQPAPAASEGDVGHEANVGSGPGAGDAMSVVASDVNITGNLVAKGELRIDGEVSGDISCAFANIGETARVKGGIKAQRVVVSGTVNGTIKGAQVVLEPRAKVEGDILYTTITIAEGAVFDGGLKRAENPLAE